jgi:hypothetical protein
MLGFTSGPWMRPRGRLAPLFVCGLQHVQGEQFYHSREPCLSSDRLRRTWRRSGPGQSNQHWPAELDGCNFLHSRPYTVESALEVQNIQSIFIDNYNTGTLIITVSGSGQVLRVPPKSQAFLPLIAGDRPVLTFTNVGANGSSQAWLMNIPALGVIWSVP